MSDVIGSCIMIAMCTTLHRAEFGVVGTFMLGGVCLAVNKCTESFFMNNYIPYKDSGLIYEKFE